MMNHQERLDAFHVALNVQVASSLLAFLRDLEAAGIDTKSHYGLTHPFATKPSKVQQQPRAWTQNRSLRRP